MSASAASMAGAPACVMSAANDARIEQWTPLTGNSHYIEADYATVFDAINGGQFPDTCACEFAIDNGAGLSWPVSIAPGQSVSFSHETFFSPLGRAPTTESLVSSVPDPLHITLDPIVVAQSVAITAGVILLVPFPSALFNSTLEENYAEVMAGVGRIRRRLAAMWAAFVAWLRGKIAARRGVTVADRPPSPLRRRATESPPSGCSMTSGGRRSASSASSPCRRFSTRSSIRPSASA